MSELINSASTEQVRVRSPRASELRAALCGPDVTVSSTQADLLDVHGLAAERIGEIALQRGIVLYELTPQLASLEKAYMDMTEDSVEYHASSITTDRSAA